MSGFESTQSEAFTQAVSYELLRLAGAYEIHPGSPNERRNPLDANGLPIEDIIYELGPTVISYGTSTIGRPLESTGIQLTETVYHNVSKESGWLKVTDRISARRLALYSTIKVASIISYAADRRYIPLVSHQKSGALIGTRRDGERDMLLQLLGPVGPDEYTVSRDPPVKGNGIDAKTRSILSAAEEKMDAERLVRAIQTFGQDPIGLIALLDTVEEPVYPRRKTGT